MVVVGTLAVVLAVGAFAFASPTRAVDSEEYAMPGVTVKDLERVSKARTFFAHQSVGQNILAGLPGVYADHAQTALRVSSLDSNPDGPGIDETLIGANGDPMGKIRDFDADLRGGEAAKIDAAILKLCYADVMAGTDVEAIFRSYRGTLAALQRDFPSVSFVAATVPMTTERNLKRKVKALLGRDNGQGPEDNLAREQLNALLRVEYADQGRLFDVAAVISTNREGKRLAYERDGATYYSLLDDYASDPGHLNGEGSKVAAEAFLSVLSAQLKQDSP